MNINSGSPSYIEQLLSLRKAKKLHTVVENKLIELLNKATPNYHPLKEPQGLAGGRNDLMLFEFSGRKVLFEIFATYNQVSRDLLILHKTDADVKIAIIIDERVDKRVFERYLKENPNKTFPFIFIGELFEETFQNCILKLREIITGDDEAKFQRILWSRISGQNFLEWCRENGIDVFSPDDIKEGNINYAKVFIALVLSTCHKQGITKSKLTKLGQWLSNPNVLEYIFLRIDIGLNMFVYTDLGETFAIYSDIELVDWIRTGYNFSQAFVIVSLNAIIYELEDKYLKSEPQLNPDRKITMSVGSTQVHNTNSGRVVILSLPNDVQSVKVIPPSKMDRNLEEYLEMIKMVEDNKIEIG